MIVIDDDEIILRHIPGGTHWQAPGPRITSDNFRLRHDRNETGVSITRQAITSPDRLVELVGGSKEKGSRVAIARVADIRALGLKVVPKPLEDDPGHSEIQSDTASLDDRSVRKQLSNVFVFISE